MGKEIKEVKDGVYQIETKDKDILRIVPENESKRRFNIYSIMHGGIAEVDLWEERINIFPKISLDAQDKINRLIKKVYDNYAK